MFLQEATLGGGCFWCLEAVYQQLRGVTHVESGYAGGHTSNPDYESVCSGNTGHAEVVRIVFDANIISYRQILEVFFAIHDPTTLNRQGNDVGTQYRSVIYTHDMSQEQEALAFIHELSEAQFFDAPIVTEVEELPPYYKAEAYHQNYFRNYPGKGYCSFVVAPKLAKFRRTFTELLKDDI